jgi:hypothetical protein
MTEGALTAVNTSSRSRSSCSTTIHWGWYAEKGKDLFYTTASPCDMTAPDFVSCRGLRGQGFHLDKSRMRSAGVIARCSPGRTAPVCSCRGDQGDNVFPMIPAGPVRQYAARRPRQTKNERGT